MKHSIFWISLLTMFALFIFLFQDQVQIPQNKVIIELNIKNKVNICLPKDDFNKEESFFDF